MALEHDELHSGDLGGECSRVYHFAAAELRRLRFFVLALLLVCLYSSRAPALELRAVVLDPVDRVVLERVHGQTSDLEWHVDRAAGPAELDRAVQLAGTSQADAVIWFEPTADRGYSVHVFDPRARRELARAVSPPQEEELASSTTAELAAFVVRSALQAIASGRSIGELIQRERLERAVEPKADAGATVRVQRSTAASGFGAALEIAPFLASQTSAPLVQPGLWLGLGVQWPGVSAGAFASTTLAPELALERATVRLRRQQLGAGLGLRLVEALPLELWARLSFGVLAYRRETSAVAAGLSPTGAAVTVSPMVAPEVLVAWAPASARWLSFIAVMAADIAPAAPTIAYALPAGTRDDRTLFRVQPRAMAGIRLCWPIRDPIAPSADH